MPTIKDIAREAGVSHGTVSNVLNKTGKVSVEKIRLVEEAAKRLGYVPNAQAQMLRQGTPMTVAVIVPSLHEDFYQDLYVSLQISLLKAGYDTCVHVTEDIAGNEKNILNRLPLSSLAAIVTVSCLAEKSGSHYGSLPCPVIFVDRRPKKLKPGQFFFSFDFHEIGLRLGARLAKQGREKIAFFCSSSSFSYMDQLLEGIRLGLGDHPAFLLRFSSDFNLATTKAFDIVSDGTDFDAIVTSSLLRAQAAELAYRIARGGRHPEILTLGASSSPLFEVYELDYSQMGVRIRELLCGFLQQKLPLPEQTLLPSKGFSYQFPHVLRQPPQEITLLTMANPSTNALEKLLPLFEEVSGIHLKLISMPYDDLHSQIEMLSQRFHFDLVRMDMARLDELGERTYLPLREAGITPEHLPQKLIARAYDSYCTINGTHYTLPFDPSVQVLLYRSDLFQDAKLSRAYYERYHETLLVPETLEQYLRVAEFFTSSRNPDSPTQYGTSLTGGSALFAASDFLPYYLANTGSVCDGGGQLRLDCPEMIHSMKQYLEMTRFATWQPYWSDSVQQFADNKTAMVAVYSNHAAQVINSKHSNVVGNIGAGLLPGGHPLLGGGVIGISKYSSRVEACRQFFHWYYSPDIASLLVRLGGTSPLVDVYNNFKHFNLFPWLGISIKSFDIGVRGTGPVRVPSFTNYRYEFALGTAVRNLVRGILEPGEAAALAQALYDNTSRA